MALRAPDMRSTHGGARRQSAKAAAAKGKPLQTHHGSKLQQRELCNLALQRARAIDQKRYFARGSKGLVRLNAEELAAGETFKRNAARRSVVAQTQTCHTTLAGRKRKAEAPPEAYKALLNPLAPAGSKAAKRQGTGYGQAAL